MGYAALIDRNLNLAFNQAKDLAKILIISKTTSNDFNFNTGAANEVSSDVAVKAIVMDTKTVKNNE